MKTGLERVACALCEPRCQSTRRNDERKPFWQDYLPEGWAAIMTIREPDPTMIGAGAHKAAEGLSEDIGGIYRAMIDAAMEGQPNAPPSGA